MRGDSRVPRANRRERESGATAIEFVLWTPLLFLLMFGSVQFGLAMFARHVAVTAAQEGARSAREHLETDRQWRPHATAAARDWVDNLIGGLLTGDLQAQIVGPTKGAYPEVGVSVSFSIVSAVPGWNIKVGATSEGPIECYYTTAGQCLAP
jgi:Flp pilus assembly protein TadG